jgi:hypothetical protein
MSALLTFEAIQSHKSPIRKNIREEKDVMDQGQKQEHDQKIEKISRQRLNCYHIGKIPLGWDFE